MKVNTNPKHIFFSSVLILMLSIFNLNIQAPSQTQSDDSLAQVFDRISFIKHAQANDILTGGDGKLPQHLRFMYFLINGAPNGYPQGMEGPDGGFLGMIRQITGPTALGGGLTSAGYSSCDSVPDTGSASMVEEGNGTYTMYFEPPLKTIPAGYTGAGGKYEKRVVVKFDGTTFFNIEFNCSTTVGWIRMNMGESNPTAGVQRNIEVYYDTTDSADARLELYMVNEPGVSTGNEYFVAKFQTASSETYKIWLVRSYNKTGTVYGFRTAVHGNKTTSNVNAFFLSESGSIADTTTGHADNNNIGSGGDVQCIDYTTPASPVAGSGCGSLGLDATAGAPINDSGDGFSIEWAGNTATGLKADMTALAEPVNP